MLLLTALGFALAVIGIVGTALPLLQYDDYWIRGWDYPRVQLSLILLLAIGVLTSIWGFSTGGWAVQLALGLSVVALVFQIFRILPYTPLWQKQVVAAAPEEAAKPYSQLHLMVSNVLQSNGDYDKLLDLVAREQPDILLTLETNNTWERQLIDGLPEGFEHTVMIPLENRYGMHLFSRLPLRDTEVHYLISDSIPSIQTEFQLDDGEWIQLYCLHPTPPSPTEEHHSTGRDAELALVGRLIRDRGNHNVIVAGDLNDVAWSHSTRLFKRLSGLLDPRQGRGLFNTFHADHWYMRWPLDHVFHSREFQTVDMCVLDHIGSDHFPVSVKLQHVPEEKFRMEEPTPENDDLEEADSTIQTAKQGEVQSILE